MQALNLLQDAKDFQIYSAGEMIFSEGEPGDYMYVLTEGEVVVTVRGKEIDRLKPGDIFGEMALVDNRPRSATVVAFTDCKMVPVDDKRFSSLVQQTPQFAILVMSVMADRLRNLMEAQN